ncbi:hypothetical protein I7I50_01830 [Histoplasma capsulatum G186AR]|uniref:Uncharacterized protein n=1 Tax=Ajellomyces capsulatus TaxID=5037 RepID=A0A8H8CSS5_AJECA|nr:hypothetical protein I7I52_12044 [Histoplasma capsulatum]QSS71105.1 hypothetical protein I7I50_01830 [Histoplasma capsulatum G186AR]
MFTVCNKPAPNLPPLPSHLTTRNPINALTYLQCPHKSTSRSPTSNGEQHNPCLPRHLSARGNPYHHHDH